MDSRRCGKVRGRQGKEVARRTDVICQKVGGEALGPVTQRRVVVGVSSEDEEGSTQKHGGVQVAGIRALLQDRPGRCRKKNKKAKTQKP